MTIIKCIGSFTLDWNLSKSALLLGWLPLQIKAKFKKIKKQNHVKFWAICVVTFFWQTFTR